MMLGVIADDFTGASDVAAMLARGGMKTSLVIGVPQGDSSVDADAVVVALKSRSIAAKEAVAQSLGALKFLQAGGARQILFKYCSTFDSTPGGNIGPVADALAGALGAKGVVVCPALPENGRVVFLGHLFVKGRLLNESGLENHPLNPMTDPDIRRWLALQAQGAVGLVNYTTVSRGPEALSAALAAAGETLVVVDATSDADLLTIGRAVRNAPLLTGGSGVAMALPENFRALGMLSGSPALPAPIAGRGVVLSGSCSPMTQRQVARFTAGHPSMAVDVPALMAGGQTAAQLVDFAVAHADDEPLIYSSADAAEVQSLQQRFGREVVAARLEHFFSELAVSLRAQGFRRIVVAGGETSGAVVTALAIESFELGPEIAPGVPVLVTGDEKPIAMALKSGNFGDEDFFGKALSMLGTR
jgi:3-dehydrotetronate 4-kinase